MGIFGSIGGGLAGTVGGGLIGGKLGGKKGRRLGEKYGALAGTAGGALLPFEKGGRIPGPKSGVPKIILGHTNEVIIPNSLPSLQRTALAQIKRQQAKEKGHTVFTRGVKFM